jgi:uncharacterized membrane protein
VPAITERVDAFLQVLLVAAGGLLLTVLWIVGAEADLVLAIVLGWDGLAVAFLARRVVLMRQGRYDVRTPAEDTDATPGWVHSARSMRVRFGAILVASACGLTSGLLVVDVDTIAGGLDSESGVLTTLKVCAALAVVLAWLILHSGYAAHYASLYFHQDRGMSFPGVRTPNHLDFSYFAYTVGTTFATSDVEVRSRAVRHAVVWHSILSFLYNAAVLGIAIGAFTGK